MKQQQQKLVKNTRKKIHKTHNSCQKIKLLPPPVLPRFAVAITANIA